MKTQSNNDLYQEMTETAIQRYNFRLRNLKGSLKELQSIDDSNFSWDAIHENLDSIDIVKEEIAKIEIKLELLK